jgi:hypothetical protein
MSDEFDSNVPLQRIGTTYFTSHPYHEVGEELPRPEIEADDEIPEPEVGLFSGISMIIGMMVGR